jgi:hypothetical protein
VYFFTPGLTLFKKHPVEKSNPENFRFLDFSTLECNGVHSGGVLSLKKISLVMLRKHKQIQKILFHKLTFKNAITLNDEFK